MPRIIRRGDTSTHGGVVVTGARKSLAERQEIARVDDILECPLHGPNAIIEGSHNVLCEGKRVAREGDHTACGAALISAAARTEVNS